MPSLIVYAVIFLAVAGVIGGAYKTVKDSGREEVRLEWQEANAAAQKKADADRKAQEAAREAQDKETSRRLANAKKRSQDLLVSLEAHIKASGTAAACPMPVSLRDDWNRANNPGEGVSPPTMPPASRPTTPSK